MSDAIITVQNLGKRDSLRHLRDQRYVALRDVLVEKATGLFRRNGRKRGPRDHETTGQQGAAMPADNETTRQRDNETVVISPVVRSQLSSGPSNVVSGQSSSGHYWAEQGALSTSSGPSAGSGEKVEVSD